MLIIAFTGLRHRIKVWENSKDLRLSATCDGRAESDAGVSKKPNWFRCMGSHSGYMYNRKGPSVSSTSRKTSFSSSFIVERWRAEHQLQFPSSYRRTLHMYRMQVSQIWQTWGGPWPEIWDRFMIWPWPAYANPQLQWTSQTSTCTHRQLSSCSWGVKKTKLGVSLPGSRPCWSDFFFLNLFSN